MIFNTKKRDKLVEIYKYFAGITKYYKTVTRKTVNILKSVLAIFRLDLYIIQVRKYEKY